MGETTGISWTDHTFNPWIGCTRVSPACDGCYAAALMGEEGRHKRVVWGEPGKGAGTRVRTKTWKEPLKWDRKAKADGVKRFVFCASLADVFDNEVPMEWRRDLFALIHATPNLIWLLLTKRPQMIVKLFDACTEKDQTHDPLSEYWPPNAFAGATVEDALRERTNTVALLRAKEALLIPQVFLSMEPLLEGVDLAFALGLDTEVNRSGLRVDWVIIGGETDQGKHKARPTHPEWERSIERQCAAAGVPFHKKQTGEWVHRSQISTGMYPPSEKVSDRTQFYIWPDGSRSEKLGKKHTGRLLDGVLHDAMPVLP